MARNRNSGSITLTGSAADDFIKGAIADAEARGHVDHSNGQDGDEPAKVPLETFPPQPARVAVDNVPVHEVRGDEIGITADGSARAEDIATPERTGADVIAELSAARLRIELAQVRWDALADELGQRAKKQHATRKAVRIGGSLYRFKFTEATKVYSLVPAADPTEIA